MSSKLPEAIFKCTAIDGEPVWASEDFRRYLIEHEGEELILHAKPSVKTAEKLKMYAFWHVNILNCAVLGYTYAGYPGMDTVKADYLLRAEFAKDFIQKPDGTYIPIMLEKKSMTKARLLKLLQDAIQFIEQDLQVEVADAQEWKVKKITGRNFKTVNDGSK